MGERAARKDLAEGIAELQARLARIKHETRLLKAAQEKGKGAKRGRGAKQGRGGPGPRKKATRPGSGIRAPKPGARPGDLLTPFFRPDHGGQLSPDEAEIDMDYFNNRRARMLKKFARSIPRDRDQFRKASLHWAFRDNDLVMVDMETEFNTNLDRLIDLAYSDEPTKISMTVELEHVRLELGHVPTGQDLESRARFSLSQYEEAFGSLGHLLDRMGYDPWYRDEAPAPATTEDGTRRRPESNGIREAGRLNELIGRAMDIIKSKRSGVAMADLGMSLGLARDETLYLEKRLVRIDGVSVIEDAGYRILIWDEDANLRDGTGGGELPGGDGIAELTREMMAEYADGRSLNKRLRQRLTREYVDCRSMAQVIRDNPDLREGVIRLHVRTSLRLPPGLRELENSGALHPDPDLSLRIALFAVNHYRWDGEGETEGAVTDLARGISAYVARERPARGGRAGNRA